MSLLRYYNYFTNSPEMVLTILNFFVQKTIDFAKNLEMMEIKGVEDHVICVISFISVFSYHIKFKPMLAT